MNTKKLKAFFLCTGFALIAAAYTTPAFAAERVTASGLTLEITETLTINSEDACRLTSDGIIVANKGSADFKSFEAARCRMQKRPCSAHSVGI